MILLALLFQSGNLVAQTVKNTEDKQPSLVAEPKETETKTKFEFTNKQNFKVAYINSYHRGYPWSDAIEHSILDGFNEFAGKVELSIEYLDSRRFLDKGRLDKIFGVLKEKYKNYPVDLVITSDNAAFDFVIKHREQLFKNVPIVFCGFNNLRAEHIKDIVNVTGVNEEVDFVGTVRLALKVHPQTTTLAFVVSERETTGQRNFNKIKQTIPTAFGNDHNIVFLKDMSLVDVKEKLHQLPQNTLLFIASHTTDQLEGKAYSSEDSSRLLAAAAPMPSYGFWGFNIGTGVVGGKVITGKQQGKAVVDMAKKILRGTPIDAIAPIMRSPTTNTFDFQALTRFNIDVASLPEDSEVVNGEELFIKQYYKQALSALIAFVFLFGFIIILLVKRSTYRKQIQQDNAKINEFKQHQKQLDKLTSELEQRVQARTQELEDARNELQHYVDIVDKHVIVSTTNAKGVITSASDAFCKVSGYSKEELIGQQHNIVRHPDMSASSYKILWDTIKAGEVWQGQIKNKSKNGDYYWVDAIIEPVFDKSGEIIAYTSVRQDITDKKRVEELYILDHLTQLYNRLKLDQSLKEEVVRAHRYKTPLSIILLDIDGFKAVNDKYGHQLGDEVLVHLARLIKNNVRQVDVPGRWGGEEFLVLCPETEKTGALALAEKLRREIGEYEFPQVGHKTCSFGVAYYQLGESLDDLIARADKALYRAKAKGKNRVEFESLAS